MASLKDIKRHIGAVRQTQKLTKAMNMVAAAKLRTTQNRAELFRFYADEHARLMDEIGRRCKELNHPLLHSNQESQKVLVLVFTSDRGLCGSFNTNVFSKLDAKIVELRAEGLRPELYVVGRKGCDYYKRRRVFIRQDLRGEGGSFDYGTARMVTNEVVELLSKDAYREVFICHTKFESLTRHVVAVEQMLPLVQEELRELSASEELDYLIEPSPQELLGRLIPRSITIMVYRAFLESVTSENAARMQAMENASKSCKDIISSLTMAYNKARQASVTSELLDIVNGAEALKG
ncbi:MAG: ATP synthase F1 subunit gamma [Deltaproteobacteria bacterium]|jgi:F-type H+-transporting ATPase subunit gamma|nr:ATP synthase F1 subunit gamma [Deltaproteobacteria bacterium]